MFDLNQAISGAGMGSAAGPWGMLAGGLLGGVMGGLDEPQTYTEADYEKDMAPYKDMIDTQMSQGQSMMDPNSMINRRSYEHSQQRAMDSMGVANTMASRNMAQQGGGMANSGLLQATVNQNLAQYSNQGLLAGDAQFQQMFSKGQSQVSGAMTHLGDYQSGLAETNINQMAAQNKHQLAQNQANQAAMGKAAGVMFGDGSVDAEGNRNTGTFGAAGGMFGNDQGKGLLGPAWTGIKNTWGKYGWDGWLPGV